MPDNYIRSQIEKNMPSELPQFTSKEEVMEHVNRRNHPHISEGVTDSTQGTTNVGNVVRGAVQRDKGDGGSSSGYSNAEYSERGGETSTLHGGDGRNAPGEGGFDGHTDKPSVFNRVAANVRDSLNKRHRSDGGTGEPEVYAAPRTRSSLKSKFDPLRKALTEPTKKRNTVGKSTASASTTKKKTVLSQQEVSELRPRLIEYITWQSEHLDQLIIATTKGHDPSIIIWSDLEDAEIELTADFLLNRGRRDPITAQAVRYAAELLDRLRIGIIYAPRVYKTISIYMMRGLDIPIWIR